MRFEERRLRASVQQRHVLVQQRLSLELGRRDVSSTRLRRAVSDLLPERHDARHHVQVSDVLVQRRDDVREIVFRRLSGRLRRAERSHDNCVPSVGNLEALRYDLVFADQQTTNKGNKDPNLTNSSSHFFS